MSAHGRAWEPGAPSLGLELQKRILPRHGESHMAKSSKKPKDTAPEKQKTKKQIALGRKEARQNRIILISVSVLVLIVVAVLAYGIIQELVIKPGTPVATVDGTDIRLNDYQNFVTFNRYNDYLSISNLQNYLDQLNASPEENSFLISFYQQQLTQIQSALTTVSDDTLDELTDDALVQQKAQDEGITVTGEEVQLAIDDYVRQSAFPAAQETTTSTESLPTPTPIPQSLIDETYNSMLGNMHLTDKAFRTIVQHSLLRGEVQDLLASQVPTTGLIVNVELIETKTQTETLAAEQRIQGGEDFAVVAQEVSTDTLTADNGGNVGWVTTGQLSERYGTALETFVFSQDVGELGVVESNGMFFLVRVLDRNENGPLPEEVLSSRQNSALNDWLTQRKASPDVKIERLLQPDQIPPDPFATASSP
jgi:foldase protein PrsA